MIKRFSACLNFAFESTASKYNSERGRRREHSRSYVTDAQRSAELYLLLAGRSVKFKQALKPGSTYTAEPELLKKLLFYDKFLRFYILTLVQLNIGSIVRISIVEIHTFSGIFFGMYSS